MSGETSAGTWRASEGDERTSSPCVPGGSLGLCVGDVEALIAQVKAGLDVEAFDRLRAALGLSADDLGAVISLSPRTLARRKKQGRLSPEESERLVRLARLFELTTDVLGEAAEAARWMKTKRPALGHRTPLERADTELGAREVEDLLGRIAHGVFY